jgi:hypothetical protein
MEEIRDKLGKLGSGKDVFRAIWDCSATVQTKPITILWVLWSVRTTVNAGERKISVEKMSYQILRYFNEFQELCTNNNDRPAQNLENWKKLAVSFLKINIDGTFFEHTKSGGWGFCIRDTDEDHVGSGAGHIAAASEAAHTEAQVCLQVIHYAIGIGI